MEKNNRNEKIRTKDYRDFDKTSFLVYFNIVHSNENLLKEYC